MDEELKLAHMASEGSPTQEPAGEQAVYSPEIDQVAEMKLVKKLDLYIIPIIMLLYLFSFLDRYATDHRVQSHVSLTYQQYPMKE